MINYKIGDLVNRINTMYTKLTPPLMGGGLSALPQGVEGANIGLIKVPYTKDNYQIICQLIKLGILQDHAPLTLEGPTTPKGVGEGQFGFCHVKLGQTPTGPTSCPPKGGKGGKILTLISKPGRKIYISYKDLKDFNNGFKLYILRTSLGIITSQTALKNKIGGEVLFKISFAS